MITCMNVSKSFEDKKALEQVSLKIKNGQITSLIGSNGAGKSTLIGTIVGYYHIDQGDIQKESISIMPDADTIYQDLTGYQFLKMICGIKACSIDEAISLSKDLKIYPHLNKKIDGYSFGMKKKITFIQAYVGKYDSYIFDEPTSGVDGPSSKIMLEKINDLTQSNAAVLLTSHNLDELERISDYIYIIDRGKIIRSGSVNDLLREEKNTDKLVYIIKTPTPADLVTALQGESAGDKIISFEIKEDSLQVVMSDEVDTIKEILKLCLEKDIGIHEFYRPKTSLYESVYGDVGE